MAEPILEVEDLVVTIDGTTILEDVSLTIGTGELLSIIGPNGAGKSTLIRCLDGLVTPDSGLVRVMGRPLGSYTRRELARIVSYVPQTGTPAFQFSVGTFVEMGRYPHLGSWAALAPDDVAAVREALAMTETDHLVDRSMASLSGGERQRVFVAAALAQGGSVLLLDEPTTHLDYRHQVQIVDLLERLHRDRGMTILAATHDLNRTVPVSDTVVALRDGRVVLSGPAVQVFDCERLAAIYDTRFRLIPVGAGSPPLVVPAVNGR
jgi:iron complex transport system ATP-binding protein